MYEGGAPGVTALTRGAYSSGISGCITAVRIGQDENEEYLSFSSATTGVAVETCS